MLGKSEKTVINQRSIIYQKMQIQDRLELVDALVQGIFIVTKNLSLSTHIGGIIENLTDKLLSALLSFRIYRLIQHK